MPATTPDFLLPYPLPLDSIDVPRDMKALAEVLDDVLGTVSAGTIPPGTVTGTMAVVAPSGWLLLDGSLILNGSSIYPLLWAVLPPSMKVGSDIKLPDARGRTLIGAGTGGGGLTPRPINTLVGAETHALTPAQIAVKGHTHTFSGSAGTQTGPDSGHTHNLSSHNHAGTSDGQSIDHSHSGTTVGQSINHWHAGQTDTENIGHKHSGNEEGYPFVTTLGGGTPAQIQAPGGTGYMINQKTNFPDTLHRHDFGTGPANTDHSHAFGTGGVSTGHTHTFTSNPPSNNTSGPSSGHTHSMSINGTLSPVENGAPGDPHNIMQPSLVVNMIMKT